jgi:arylsulfatase A-like enzyme
MRGGVSAACLVALALLASTGCRQAPDPLEVERWVIASPRPTKRLWGQRDRCEVDSDTRPALGCPQLVGVSPVGEITTTPKGLARRYRIPVRALGGRAVLFERTYRRKGEHELTRLPPLVVSEIAPETEIEFPISAPAAAEAYELSVKAYVVPPDESKVETEAVRITPGSFLEGAIALDGLAVSARASPVEFLLRARSKSGERTLLEQTIDPASASARGWIDYRIDLAGLAGQEVRFLLSTRVLRRTGDEVGTAFGLPLWSGGRILAPRRDSRTSNVILVSIDTLRADHLGAYGAKTPTPNLDRFAAEGVLFENVVAPYPSTTASHMSMLTGLYPDVHGILAPVGQLSEDVLTLAELFATNGYQTAAVTEDGMVAAKAGFARGFGFYREFKDWDPARTDGYVREGVSSALEWLDRHRGERFFFFLHNPYAPPDEFRAAVAEEVAAKTGLDRDRALYEGEVLYTDHEIGRLLSGLDERGLADDTVVVVTADHGEAFGEHGTIGHGWFLNDAVLSVPLVMRAPWEIPAGVRVPTPVSLVDVTPTLLQLAGLRLPTGRQGVSLLPLIADPTSASYRDRTVFSQHDRGDRASFVLRRGDRQWSFRKGEEPAVFDLRTDPHADHPIADPALIAEGRRLLDDFRQGSAKIANPEPARVPLDDATREKLRRLGYID